MAEYLRWWTSYLIKRLQQVQYKGLVKITLETWSVIVTKIKINMKKNIPGNQKIFAYFTTFIMTFLHNLHDKKLTARINCWVVISF